MKTAKYLLIVLASCLSFSVLANGSGQQTGGPHLLAEVIQGKCNANLDCVLDNGQGFCRQGFQVGHQCAPNQANPICHCSFSK